MKPFTRTSIPAADATAAAIPLMYTKESKKRAASAVLAALIAGIAAARKERS